MRETVAARAGPQGPSNSIAQELPSLAAYYTLNNYFDAYRAKNFPDWGNWLWSPPGQAWGNFFFARGF